MNNLLESKKSAYRRFVDTGKLQDWIVNTFADADRSGSLSYVEKMCEFFIEEMNKIDTESMEPVIEKISDFFYMFDYYKRHNYPLTPKEKNINSYKKLSEFEEMIKKYENYESKRTQGKKKDSKITGKWEVIPIYNKEQMCNYGTTNWCIARREGNYWWTYRLKNLSFYILRNKDEKKLHLLELNNNDFSFKITDGNVSQTVIEKGDDTKRSDFLNKKGLSDYSFKPIPFSNAEINHIATDAEHSYNYATDILKGQNVPDMILKGIETDAEYSYRYAKNILEGQNVPDMFLKRIATDVYCSYRYAKDVLKNQNVPDMFLKAIATSAWRSYRYANDVLKGQNVPDIILKSIVTSAQYSYLYAKNVFKGQNVPDMFLKRIATDAGHSYQYAKYVLKGKNVPDMFLKTIATSAGYSYYYAKDVLKGQNVPDIILKTIATDADYSYRYELEFGSIITKDKMNEAWDFLLYRTMP
jgi:hypothetical protein